MVGALALRKHSFHQIDLFARTKEAKQWLGSDRRMVASDATLWRVLPLMNRSELRAFVHKAYRLLRKQGHGSLELPSRRSIRAAAVDGTCWGKQYASAVEILGDPPVVLDFEVAAGEGHELATSAKVLRRVFKEFGKGFVDIVLGDGLYITQEMMRLCREDLGTHLLVKTKELGTLLILQDAEAIFARSDDRAGGVERGEGVDLERGLRFRLWAARGFHHAQFDGELKVARVETEPLKGQGKSETFWIVTTDPTLSGNDMRELAHRRWSIENHGFRALNDAMNSKHVWTRGKNSAQTFEALMLLMLLSFLLVTAFHAQLNEEDLWKRRRLRRLTLRQLAEEWMLSLHRAAGLFADTG
jgi:DDE family transposase